MFFGIATSLKELVPDILNFWPETQGKIHIDDWREVNYVGGFKIDVVLKSYEPISAHKLFFINLGGYKPLTFDELQYKILSVDTNRATTIAKAKQTIFYEQAGFKGAESHIDNKYGVDVDDILPSKFKMLYSLNIYPNVLSESDFMHLGYLPIQKVEQV